MVIQARRECSVEDGEVTLSRFSTLFLTSLSPHPRQTPIRLASALTGARSQLWVAALSPRFSAVSLVAGNNVDVLVY